MSSALNGLPGSLEDMAAKSADGAGSPEQERLLVESIPGIVWIAAPDGRREYYNRRWHLYTGLSVEESLGTGWLSAAHPDDRQRAVDEWKTAAAKGRPYEIEIRIRRASDGTYRWHLARALPLRDKTGRIVKWFGTTIDIHDRKKLEEELRKGQQNLADFFDNAAVCLHWVGPDGAILRANQAELDLLGYTEEEYIGRDIREFHADLEVIQEILDRLARGEELKAYPARLLCKDGSIREVLIDSNVLWEDGRFIHTRCFTRDVTEANRTQRRLLAEHGVTQALAAASRLDDAAAQILEVVARSIDCSIGVLWRAKAGEEPLTCRHVWQDPAAGVSVFAEGIASLSLKLGKGLAGRAWALRSPVWLNDPQRDLLPERAALAEACGIRSGISFPVVADGSCFGVLEFFSCRQARQTEAVLDMLSAISSVIAQVLHREQTEAALRRSDQQIASILETISESFFAIDEDGRITYMNPQAERYFRQPRSELIGRSVWEMYPQAIGTELHRQYQWVLYNRQPMRSELFFEPTQTWFELNLYPSPTGVSIYFRDISERKRVEEELRESEARFRLMADHAPVLIWMSGPDKLYTYFNRGWLEFTGRTLEQELGTGWAEGVHPDDLDRCLGTYEEAFDTHQPFEMEYRLRRSDGAFRWMLDRGAPRFTPDGTFTGHIGSLLDITERRDAEAALRESEARGRAILETAVDAIITIDEQCIIESFNPAAERMFGYAPHEVIGQNVKMLMPPPYAGEHDQYVANYLHTGDPKIIGIGREVMGRRKDGSAFPMELAVSEVKFGGRRMFTGIVRDITERRQAEAALRESEARTRAILETAVDAIITIDEKCIVESFNPAAERMFGYQPHEVIGRNVKMLMPPPYTGEHDQYVANYLRTGDPKIIGIGREVIGRRKDGGLFPMELAVSEGRIAGRRMFTGIVRDITERRQAEAALRESEARTRAILETAVDAIITIDEKGIIESYNPAAERVFEYTSEEVIGRNVKMLMPPPYEREHDQYLRNYVETGQRKIIGIGREVVGRRKSGELFPMDLAVSEVRFGDRRMFTGIVRDISERKLAEQTIREQKQEMEDFLCIVAHDLKRPVVSVRGLLGMMKEDIAETLDEDNRENLDLLLSECDRMRETIALLSGIARIGQIEANIEDVQVHAFLRKVVDRFQGEIQERGVQVKLDATDQILRFPRLQVEEALENLIDNALKYGCTGPRPEMTVKCNSRGSSVRISVADNGPGIPPEHHERVFELFRRLDSTHISGSGVGLTAVQRLMKRIDGDVELASTPGGGATFTLRFSSISETSNVTGTPSKD